MERRSCSGARDDRLGRLVALKILAPALAGDTEFQRRFISESRAAAAIDDPHIVPVFAVGDADGVLFIAMRYVVYLGGKQANAEVYGVVGKAVSGEVAAVYAQPFPFKKAPTQVGSVILHPVGTTARYDFQVTPAFGTRYRVELFHSSTASAPFATSGTATIYVVSGGTSQDAKTCSRPVCHPSLLTTYLVPPSVLQTEMSKQWYVYFGINLAPTKEPPQPQWLHLGAGGGHVTAPHRMSADEFSVTVTFSFQIGNDAYSWSWATCPRDTEAEDGIGLPGHHGCGDECVPSSSKYVG